MMKTVNIISCYVSILKSLINNIDKNCKHYISR